MTAFLLILCALCTVLALATGPDGSRGPAPLWWTLAAVCAVILMGKM